MSGHRRSAEGAQLGVRLACIGGLLLFFGWVLSQLRRGYALDDVDVDKLLGVGSGVGMLRAEIGIPAVV